MLLVLAFAAAAPFVFDGSLKPGQSLHLSDVNGSIRVRTGDRLSVHATKHAERGDPNAVTIRVENDASGVVVCVQYAPNANRSCRDHGATDVHDNDTVVDFEVTVPRGIALDAQTVNGSIDAVNDGPADAKAVNGSIRLEARDVRTAEAVNGSVRVKVTDRTRAALDASTVNGSIEVTLPPGTGVALDAKTLTGGINADGITVERARFGTGATANVTLGDGARRITLKTVNGSITLHR